MKHSKIRNLSYRLVSIVSFLLVLCLTHNQVNAQELNLSKGPGAITNVTMSRDIQSVHISNEDFNDIANVPISNSIVSLSTDCKGVSIVINEKLITKKSLTSYEMPQIQKKNTKSVAFKVVNVSGIIDASTLEDNAELVLTGNTNLFMDVNKTLKCISGDYTLTLSGGNILTLNNPEDYAINVLSITISAPLIVKSSNVAISAQNGITINSTVNATSTNTGIGTVNGTLTINADVTVTTNSSAAILNRGLENGGDIIINNGVIKATGGNSGVWAYGIAARGSITSQAGTIINATGGTGIYAEEGNIHMAGDVVSIAKGETGSGVYAEAGEVTLSTISVSSSCVGISARNGLTLNGDVEINSADTGLGTVNGTLTINGDVTVTTNSSAAILNRGLDNGGDIIINNGVIKATGGNSGVWAYGIAARGSITSQAGTIINATGGTGIYAEDGNIHLAGDVVSIAKGEIGYGVYAEAGEVSLSTISVPSSQVGISAKNGLTLNGDVEINSADTGIGTVNGTLTINGDVTVTTNSSAAILNRGLENGGDIIINNGVIKATGGNSGIWAYGIAARGNLNIKSGEVVAKGGTAGLYAEDGAITITSPLIIVSPWEGQISNDGHYVVDENNEVQTRVVIMTPPISGTITLASTPVPGESLGISLSGNISLNELSCIWQISENNDIWKDIDGATEKVYVPKESELGKYLRVRAEAIGYSGYLYSPSHQITKRLCANSPVAPTLTNINDKVHVSNAKTTQEYIIFNYSKDVSTLTENDWNNAVTPDSEVGFFEMNSTANSNHTVFTRVKETTSAWASESVAEGRIYIGTSVYLQDIELNISKTVGYFQKFYNELNCKVGDVIRCDASPVPSDATNWYGISGSNWTVGNRNTGSPYGEFYEDEECTIPINTTSNYETVYLKTLAEKNYLEVRIQTYNSSIGYKTRAVQFNVSYDGTFPPIEHLSGCSHTIAAGEKMTNLDVARRPLSASVYGVTTEVTGEGTAPIVRFDFYEKMNIDATNATPGVYTYTPIQNGNPITTSTFTITVTDGNYNVESVILRDKYITADPGDRIELVAQLMPTNSKAEIEWHTTDENIAPVVDGVVTIAADAPIGAEVYITALANGCYDNCKITVSGKEYDLYVASTQVTSRNSEDILGDGKFSFNNYNILTINGDYTLNTPVKLVENKGIDGLIIDVEGNSTINQEVNVESNVFDFATNTVITGEGQLTINANAIGIGVNNGANLTIFDTNVTVNGMYPMTGNIGGNESLSIVASNVEISAKGSAAVDDFNGGISLVDCVIATPIGGEVVDATIEDGKGNYARKVVIKSQVMLYDDINNTVTLETYAARDKKTNAQLVNRTFYKDNSWTTLCLPFDVNNFNGTPLEGATVMELNTASRNGFDSTIGVLYLSFRTVTAIEAGKPYIVKWDNGENIVNPVFENVVITNYEPMTIVSETFELDAISMIGCYAPVYVSAGDQSIVFMGTDKVLYHTSEDATLNSFHSYFEIPSLQGEIYNGFIIDFDGTYVGIDEVKVDNVQYPEGWYTITGIKLPQMPTERGIYINNGRKVLVW